MPKVKVARKSTAIDMTAMCDVAFLYWLSSWWRRSSGWWICYCRYTIVNIEIKLPETDILNVTISSDGKVFFNIDNKNFTRERLLARISEKYPELQFTPEEERAFVLTGTIVCRSLN